MEQVDLLIRAVHVVPVAPRGVLEDHAVAVKEGRIVAVLPAAEARPRLPGLVNIHSHAAMSLMRGIADDVPLMTWLRDHVWPAEARHVTDEMVHDGSLLAMAEMLRAGTTCVNDMYFFPEATARAALKAGMRASLGVIALDFPSAYAPDAASYITRGLQTRDAYRGEPLLAFTLAPHAPYTVGDETLRRVVVLAEELDCPIHMHVHETATEVSEGFAHHGARPLARMASLGLVGPRLIAVHAVHLDERELDMMEREGVSVAHCPSSNLKLASGIARVADMRTRGINVALGTDGAASNNRLDVMTEMRTAALLAKGTTGDAGVVPAHEALEMATLAGARALGLERDIGSIEAGKQADLAAIELSSLETQPCYDPVSHIVYAAGREHVTHVWVSGEARVEDRALRSLDAEDLAAKAAWWRGKMAP